MPGGKVHSALTLATASGVLAPYLLVQFNGNPYEYVAGVAVGLLITPDLDLNNGNISDTMIRKMFPPAQWLWRLLWTPYSLLIPHRSIFSHFPLLGTALRIGYIFLVINLARLLGHFIFQNFDTVLFIWNWSLFFGLCHADLIHWAADITIKSKEQFEGE